MRFFFIITLFLVLTISSMAKTAGRLQLRGTIPFATHVSLKHHRHSVLLTVFSNAQKRDGLQIIVKQDGMTTVHTPNFLRSKKFTTLINQSKQKNHPIFLTLRAL